jgi:hypothetical protein
VGPVMPLRGHPNLSRAEPTPPVMQGGGKARLKKISLWSKAQDKPRLHNCRPLAPGAFRARSGKSIRTSAAGFHHFRCWLRMIE